MNGNMEIIAFVIDYIEEHLTEDIDLETLSHVTGYSKYHLHRMFTQMIGFPVHKYINRRRLTEAAKQLLFTKQAILEIALDAGYESQRAFTLAFKKMYKVSPQAFRKKHEFYPIQLKFQMDGNLSELRGDRIMDIKIIDSESIYLIGYMGNTKKGFFVIPRLWYKLHKTKNSIPNRICMDYLVGVNDYSKNFSYQDKNPAFDYYAAVEVSNLDQIPAKMQAITRKASKYVIFTFKGRTQDSLQPVIEYIYKEWLPQSSCQLNENAKYELIRYGEIADEKGQSSIEVWIPIV